MQIKELLLALNELSSRAGYTYVLQYNYQYTDKYNKIYLKLMLLEYVNSKLVNKTRINGEISAIQMVADKIKEWQQRK